MHLIGVTLRFERSLTWGLEGEPWRPVFNGVVYEENFMEAVQIPFHRWKLNEHVLDVLELQILRMKLLLLGIYLVRVLDPL